MKIYLTLLTSGAIQIVLGVLLISDNHQIGCMIILLGIICRIIGRVNKLYEIFQYKRWKSGRTIRRYQQSNDQKRFELLTFKKNKTMAKRIYNIVMDDRSGVCPMGELLTDKELEHIRLYNCRRDFPNTAKVTVKSKKIYFSFGVRFADDYELIKQEK